MQMAYSGGGYTPPMNDAELIRQTKRHYAQHYVPKHYSPPAPRVTHHATHYAAPHHSYNSYGLSASAVKQLQHYLGISADGIYGDQTTRAVRAYQAKHGLAVDGIAGAHTLASLRNGAVHHAVKQASRLPARPKANTVVAKITHSAPAKPDTSFIDNINKQYDAQQKKQLADLQTANNKAIGQINNQKKQTAAEYYGKRNQADVVSNQNAQKLREIMANNGLLQSGENITANVNLNNARQQSLGDLNNAQQQQNNVYAQQISSINDPSKATAIKESIAQQRNAALATAKWQQYQYNNMSASQKAQLDWAKKQYGEDAAWRMYALNTNNAQQASLAQQQINAYKQGFNDTGGGGDLPSNYKSNLAQAMNKAHIPSSQLAAFNWVIQHESSFNPNAKNPKSTAHGYGQFLNSTVANYDRKMGLHYNSSPVDQLAETYQYMVDRYGSPQGAMKFWQKNHWY